MCSHYVLQPVAYTPALGWEKGQVENQVGLVRERFVTPGLRFKSHDELNTWLLDKCAAYAWPIAMSTSLSAPSGTCSRKTDSSTSRKWLDKQDKRDELDKTDAMPILACRRMEKCHAQHKFAGRSQGQGPCGRARSE
jgi:hypothetical protein